MSGPQRRPNRLPNAVFELRVWRARDRLAGAVRGRDLGDRVAAGAIFGVSKAGMIGIEVNDPHFDVVQKQWLSFS
jgi:hypothetical protein